MGCEAAHRGREREKAEKHIFGFLPLDVPRKGFSPHIPATRLFVHFHTTKPTIPSQKKEHPFWSCLQCTPSLTLPPSSLKCLQKSNPNIHSKCIRCFKCFGCFRCFISLLDHKTARFWSKSELNPQTARIVTPSSNGYGKHPKRQSTHLPASPHTILSCKL